MRFGRITAGPAGGGSARFRVRAAPDLREETMSDFLLLGLGVVLFALSVGYSALCNRL